MLASLVLIEVLVVGPSFLACRHTCTRWLLGLHVTWWASTCNVLRAIIQTWQLLVISMVTWGHHAGGIVDGVKHNTHSVVRNDMHATLPFVGIQKVGCRGRSGFRTGGLG
jgi:hypothetical protein